MGLKYDSRCWFSCLHLDRISDFFKAVYFMMGES